GAAAVLALFCLIGGISAFFGDSSPEGRILADATKLEQQRLSGGGSIETTKDPKDKGKVSEWKAVKSTEARIYYDTPLFDPFMAGSSLRFNPKILAIDFDQDKKEKVAVCQLDYINQGIYVVDGLDERAERLKGFIAEGKTPTGEAVFVVKQKRMVVVSATFPYLEQAEWYRKALRFERLDELFARGLAPAFEGLNVQRRKITTAGGKTNTGDWENVYMADANGKVEVSRGIAALMQQCVIDENQVDKYYDVIYGSSVTPLPTLANGEADYPDIKLASLANRVAPAVPVEPKMK